MIRPTERRSRGWSLIECLVVVAVIAVVLGIALPTISAVRGSARDRADGVSLRTHAQAFTLYSSDYAGVLPRFYDVGRSNELRFDGQMLFPAMRYFDAFDTWHVVLAREYYGLDFRDDSFFSARTGAIERVEGGLRAGFHYGCSFVASPEFWNELTRTGERQLRGVRLDAGVFPADKALIVRPPSDAELGRGRYATTFAALDGATRVVEAADRVAGYWRGDGPQLQAAGAVHFKDAPPLLHTVDGIRGRDVR